jgi:hypothetical protein
MHDILPDNANPLVDHTFGGLYTEVRKAAEVDQKEGFEPLYHQMYVLAELRWGIMTARTGGLVYWGVSRCLQAERHTFARDFTLWMLMT